MKLVYVGPHTAGVTLSSGLEFPHGEPVEVDSALAESLLAVHGSDFVEAKAEKPQAGKGEAK